jgi:glycosyltransferase involved in cell wall biosynthesis
VPKTIRLEEAPSNVSSTVWRMEYPEARTVGTIAIPCRDHINAATTTSLLMTDYGWLSKGETVDRFIIQGGILTMQRNEAVQRMDGDWLVFIDDDMVFDAGAVGRLVKARDEGDYDILGGLCFRRNPPHQPTLYMREGPTDGQYNFLEDWQSDVVEVDATGMAFCVIHKRVFEAIAGSPMPPREERLKGKPGNFFRWNGTFGEDLQFCMDAKAAGCRIYVDTRNEIGHVAEVTIDKRWFWREIATREPEVEAIRQELNDTMGLPTLRAQTAKERLGWT